MRAVHPNSRPANKKGRDKKDNRIHNFLRRSAISDIFSAKIAIIPEPAMPAPTPANIHGTLFLRSCVAAKNNPQN